MIDTFGDNLLEGFEYESPSHEGNQFKDFLCVLEGFKTKFKNLHWSAYSNSIHVRVDELIDKISGYQDILAEEVQGIALKSDSLAESINNATVANKKWWVDDSNLYLIQEKQGAEITTDTIAFEVEAISADSLILRDGEMTISYKKQN